MKKEFSIIPLTIEAKADASATAAPVLRGMLPPDDLPKPPKIGTIKVGNVVQFKAEPQAPEITPDDEWMQVCDTVIAAFSLIKDHRDRLIHDENKDAVSGFGQCVNVAWKTTKQNRVNQ